MQVKVKFLAPIQYSYIIMWIIGNSLNVMGSNTMTQGISESSEHINVSSANSSIRDVPLVETNKSNTEEEGCFPKDFLFGVSTSAFQIEGAWNVSDKSESNWDFMTHHWPETIIDESNADISANSYYLYKTDIKLMKKIGANAYRMSLSWPRILPTGFINYISEDGIRYYNNIINELLANDIKPHVTIFHWDLPQKLQELGGWTNPLIVDWFVDYAQVVFNAFGDRVKLWSTINEPSIMCGYDFGGDHVPATHQSGIADYLCGHYSLLAHSKVYRMYNEKFRSIQNGDVGIILNFRWATEYGIEGETDGTESWFQWHNNWFLHPLFTDEGDYPNIMKERIAEYSKIQGFSKSRLPQFSKNDIEMIKYSCDFLGINFYTTELIERSTDYNVNTTVSLEGDIGMKKASKNKLSPFVDPNCTPWSFVSLIKRVIDQYNTPMLFITENGYPDSGELIDCGRAEYYHAHLTELSKLIAQGIDVHGYFAWSLLDNFEWTSGYSKRYGLFSINFADPDRKRVPKFSTEVISNIYHTGKVSRFSRYSDVTCDYENCRKKY